MKKWLIFLAVLVGLNTVPFICNDKGDYLGPLERGLRAVLNGWDMWDTEAIRPYETPQPALPEGIVPFGGRQGYTDAVRQLGGLDAAAIAVKGELAYRRYCGQCHGAAGDGRTVVGESFEIAIPDLREGAQELSDEELYDIVTGGSGRMLALEDSLTPLERLLTARHIRTLPGRHSEPVYPARSTSPLE